MRKSNRSCEFSKREWIGSDRFPGIIASFVSLLLIPTLSLTDRSALHSLWVSIKQAMEVDVKTFESFSYLLASNRLPPAFPVMDSLKSGTRFQGDTDRLKAAIWSKLHQELSVHGIAPHHVDLILSGLSIEEAKAQSQIVPIEHSGSAHQDIIHALNGFRKEMLDLMQGRVDPVQHRSAAVAPVQVGSGRSGGSGVAARLRAHMEAPEPTPSAKIIPFPRRPG